MDLSAQKPMKPPPSFPLNQNNYQNNNNYPVPVNNPIPYQNQNEQPIIVNQVIPQIVHVVAFKFGTSPVSITCQFCRVPITTIVHKSFNFCSCLLCYCTGLLVWICVQLLRGKELNCCDAQHTCPNCGQILGIYSAC